MNLIHRSLFFCLSGFVLAGCAAGDESPDQESTTVHENEAEVTAGIISRSVLGDSRTRSVDGMEMVFVPAGEFEMGSDDDEVDYALQLCKTHDTNCSRGYFAIERPRHMVEIGGYWLDKTEVTVGQYEVCETAGVCTTMNCQDAESQAEANHPVSCLTWDQASTYCEWAGGQLSTEAEWEYAARGTDQRRYPWGNEFDGTLLNYCDENCGLSKRDDGYDDGHAESAPVGSYPGGKSWVGALDMAGNVWEWTADWYGPYPSESQVDPIGPEAGSSRVARGGSWHTSPDHTRSALRTFSDPGRSYNHMGFRCAMSLLPGELSP